MLPFAMASFKQPEIALVSAGAGADVVGWDLEKLPENAKAADIRDAATRLAHSKIARLNWGAGYPPARTALDLPLSREVAKIMAATGHDPIRLPTVGGSIPMYLFQQPNQTPVIGLPIVNHDDNHHAADENLRLQNLWDGIEIYAALFTGLTIN
jgi:acetylornithine deacetylase/succinyl-diaminopimelate desuccinylase-like protein